jgi:ribosomal protein S18 acetylase RimI-like enzyme
MRIAPVTEADLPDLLPLMRAYCDFYRVAPSDDDLLAMSRALIADHEHEGVQLLARDSSGAAVGFATVFWSWQTLDAGRAGVMNDLYVVAEARGRGIGRALIEECRGRCRERGAKVLVWDTAPDNHTAQALYRSLGAEEESWLAFSLATDD